MSRYFLYSNSTCLPSLNLILSGPDKICIRPVSAFHSRLVPAIVQENHQSDKYAGLMSYIVTKLLIKSLHFHVTYFVSKF